MKELKEGQGNARIREVRSKSNSSDDTNASRSSREDDLKVRVSFSSYRDLEFFRDETNLRYITILVLIGDKQHRENV